MGKATVKRIICGIMFQHSFSLLDEWGKIVDAMLYKKNPYFSPQYFPTISEQYTTNRFLNNREQGHMLQLNSNNLIYTHTIQGDFEKEYNDFVLRIEKYLVPKIVDKYGLVTRRIGMVYMCDMDDTALSDFKKQYFIKAANEITDCRFAIRSTTPEGLLFANNDNYINKIYTVGGIDETIHGISFDYQLYFQPAQPEISTKISAFFETSKKSFFEEIFKEEYRGKQ